MDNCIRFLFINDQTKTYKQLLNILKLKNKRVFGIMAKWLQVGTAVYCTIVISVMKNVNTRLLRRL